MHFAFYCDYFIKNISNTTPIGLAENTESTIKFSCYKSPEIICLSNWIDYINRYRTVYDTIRQNYFFWYSIYN